MIEWVAIILKSFIEMEPENVIPLLVLDSYRCHMICGGGNPTAWYRSGAHPWWMYFSLQPVDIRINKGMKTIVCKDWEDWMLDSGINVLMVKPCTQQLIVEWVIKAFDSFSVDFVQHSWKHGVYSWFH